MEEDDNQMALRKMLWINTSIAWIAATLSFIVVLSLWTSNLIYKILIFLVFGLIASMFWLRWNKNIEPYLK